MPSRLTFIIPAFNAAATITATLDSLRAQTLKDWYAIVIDDGSTDATARTVQSVTDRRIRLITQKNRGLAGARNTGLQYADADHISFLDADDTVCPRFAETMLGAIRGFDIVACAYEMTGPDG